MNTSRIPTILGLAVLILSLAIGIMLIHNQQLFSLRASPVVTPKQVRVSNVTDTSFTVSWVTDRITLGSIRLYDSKSLFPKTYVDSNEGMHATHFVQVTNLQSEREYSFSILSNESGVESARHYIKTLAKNHKKTSMISGKVVQENSSPVANALIHLTIGGNYFSTVSSDIGSWYLVIPVNDDNRSPQTLEIVAQTSPTRMGVTEIQFTGKDILVPSIMIGRAETYTDINLDVLITVPPAKL